VIYQIKTSIVIPSIAALLSLLTFTASGQSPETKLEVGAQSTSLTLFHPDFFGDLTQPGFGGRVTYNFTRVIAADAEINFFPQKNGFLIGQGRAIQGQFGVKAGKRFEKFGLFGKVRPGFLSIDDAFSLDTNHPIGGAIFPVSIHRKTLFTTDLGGVLEFYPGKRTIVRFDGGDTIIRYGPEFDFLNFPETQAKTRHNFQFTAGVSFRIGDIDDTNVAPTLPTSETPRYEAGIQFTSLSVQPPRALCSFLCGFPPDRPIETEPGLGGRFTFNLTHYLGFDAEGNWFTRDHGTFTGPGGHIFQGQFGPKVGKRFERWGFFGKARPGFVGFTKTLQLVGTHPFNFAGIPTIQGDFEVGTKLYPSFDFGGVLEFYVSRRVMTRMDFGDTIIRYGEYAVPGFPVSMPIFRRPPETRHNFQFNAGIGFRF
jgi:hypothetical protein